MEAERGASVDEVVQLVEAWHQVGESLTYWDQKADVQKEVWGVVEDPSSCQTEEVEAVEAVVDLA